MKRFLLITMMACLAAGSATAQTSTADTTEEKTSTLSTIAAGVLTYAIFIPTHELGHFVTAKLAGTESARMVFLFIDDEEGLSIRTPAATIISTNGMTRTDMALIGISGSLATRLLAEGSDLIWRGLDHSSRYPTFGEKFFSLLFIVGRMDFAGYVLNDAVLNLAGEPGGDYDIFVTAVAGQNTAARVLTYTGLFAIAAADLYFDADRVTFHANIIMDKRTAPEPPRWGLRIGPGIGGGLLGANFSMLF
jgi:hypothetical protein